jgi:hypothetical protein
VRHRGGFRAPAVYSMIGLGGRSGWWIGIMFWAGFACGVGAFLVSAVLVTVLSERARRNSSRNDAARIDPAPGWPVPDTYNTRTLSPYHASNENTPPKYESAKSLN